MDTIKNDYNLYDEDSRLLRKKQAPRVFTNDGIR